MIAGKKNIGSIVNEADKVQASLLKADYENWEFTVPGGGYTNVSLKAIFPSAFSTIDRAHTIVIRSNADMSFRFNGGGNPSISLLRAEGSFTSNSLEIDNIYFTAPAGAVIKVFMV